MTETPLVKPITRYVRWRVEVMPYLSYREHTDENVQRACKDLVSAIKRHIDDTDGIEIACDTETLCPFCQRDWEPFFDEGEEGSAPEWICSGCGENIEEGMTDG